MAEMVMGNVGTIVGIALQIKQAADTVRRNKNDCGDIAKCVVRNSALLKRLEEGTKITEDEAMCGPLEDLTESLEEALKLVTECQKRHIILRFCGAGDMATDLRRVQEDIVRKIIQASLATQIHGTILMTNFLEPAAQPAAELLPQVTYHRVPSRHFTRRPSRRSHGSSEAQNAGAVDISGSGRSTDDARSLLSKLSEENNDEETMVSPGWELPSSPSPGFRQFSLSELKVATNNFSVDNNIGSGGFSTVYKGVLRNGLQVAVKKFHEPILSSMLCDEISVHVKLQHKNIVKLVGYCIDSDISFEWIHDKLVEVESRRDFLILSYIPNSSLGAIIEGTRRIDWPSCFQVIQGIAQGVNYIHQQGVVHMDLKPCNILFDWDMNPVIIDFGLSTVLAHDDDELILDTLRGTLGFLAPEVIHNARVSKKSDMYAFGVTLLQTIGIVCTGSSNRQIFLADYDSAVGVERLLDPSLQLDESQVMEIARCVQVAKLCTEYNQAYRPTIGDVLKVLNGEKESPSLKKPIE